MSQTLLEIAINRAPETLEWTDGGWQRTPGSRVAPGEPVAIVEAARLQDDAPLEALVGMVAEARVFVVGERRSSRDARGLAVARAWFVQRDELVLSVDDEVGRWVSLSGGSVPTEGSVIGFLGFRPLVVAAVAHLGDMGGASRAHLELARELTQRGHLIHTFTPAWSAPALPQALRSVGVSTSRHSCRWWAGIGEDPDPSEAGLGVTELVADIGQLDPDLVLSETAVLPGGALAARALGIPHVWMLHERVDPNYGLHPPGSPEQLGEAIRSLSAAVLVNSRFVGDHFFGETPPDSIVAPISVREFDLLAEEASIGRPEGATGRPYTLAVVGQITPAKGQLDAVEALGMLRAKGRETQLRVFGSGSAEAIDQLSDRVQQLGLEHSVFLEGHRRDLPKRLAACDAVVIGSWAEGFSRVAVEAAALGLPIVYANSGGLVEYMIDGTTGLAVEAGDAARIADAVLQLMDDRASAARLAAEARARVRSWLQEHDAADALESVAAKTRRPGAAGPWGARLVSECVTREAIDITNRVSLLDAWPGADLGSPAAVQGALLKGERMSRLLSQWVGEGGSGRSLLPRGLAASAARLGGRLPRRVRVALLVAAVDPTVDSLVVERCVDPEWYARTYGVPPARDSVVEYARRGLREGHRPNAFIDPEWYRLTNPDVAVACVPPIRHYFAYGCFEGRAPGPTFDPDAYLRANPDVAASALLPLEHYMMYGREEGRTW